MGEGFSYLDIEKRADGIAILKFGDPNDDNFVSHSHPMHRELREVFPALEDDNEIEAVVIIGGEDEFCPAPGLANLDMLLTEDPSVAERLQNEANDIVSTLIDFSKPTVAVVAKPCAGFGPQLAFLCDALVATPDSYFRDLHVRVGLTAGDGGTLIWPLLFGLGRARRHLLRSVPMSGEEAFRLGAVDEIAENENKARDAGVSLAAQMVDLPNMAFKTTKSALAEWLRFGYEKSMLPASRAEVATFESPEFLERRRAARKAATERE